MPINTLYQLYAHSRQQPGELEHARRLLLIPDVLHSWLSGAQVSERTNATTTQFWDPVAGAWASDLLERLGIPTAPLPEVVEPGTPLGPALPELPELRGDLGDTLVIAPATHDTGSAIAAAPAGHAPGWAYISSGTWSLVGAEVAHPILTPEALAASWTNEGGVFGTTRFLKNVMGLRLLQERQRTWARELRPQDYGALLAEVEREPPLAALIDPDDQRFLAPAHMPGAINDYLRERGQPSLETPAAFTRCILESLVLRYCQVVRQLERLTGIVLTRIHIVGGGSRNERLNQWLADALGVTVVAGSAEATALGNALMQLAGLGELRMLAELRDIARATPTRLYEPNAGAQAPWREAAQRFAALTAVGVQ